MSAAMQGGEDPLLTKVSSIITSLLEKVDKTRAAFLFTIDGHLLVRRPTKFEMQFDQVCAIGSSFVGLSESMVGFLEAGEFKDFILRGDDSLLAIFKIGDQSDSLVLAVKADNSVNLGLLLSRGQQTAAELREFVDQMAGA